MHIEEILSFDDLLLQPQHSVISSRLDVSLHTRLTKKIKLNAPIVSTNMSSVTGIPMIKTMNLLGCAGFLHRFHQTVEELKNDFEEGSKLDLFIPSVGVTKQDLDVFLNELVPIHQPKAILIDIAHGDSLMMVNAINLLCEELKDTELIIGNFGNWESLCNLFYQKLIKYPKRIGAVRVGIGSGSHCTTRTVTGHGYTNCQFLIDRKNWNPINKELVNFLLDIPIIVDGGIKTSGDIVKALALGADTVCIGNLLSATSNTPGEVEHIDGRLFKAYYGESSHYARMKAKGKLRRGLAEEGFKTMEPFKGPTSEVVEELIGGIKSGLTYSNAKCIPSLRNNAKIFRLTSGGRQESKF